IAYAAGHFYSTTASMTVSGQSGHSNGIATLFNRGRNDIDREFRALNQRDGLSHEPTVPNLPVFPHVPVADAFAFAKRTLFPDIMADLDRHALARACVTGARVTAGEWPAALAAVRASLADVPGGQKWFDAELANSPHRPPPAIQLRPQRLGFDGTFLNLDAAAFGVTDVAGAARLCDSLLSYSRHPIEYARGEDDRHIAATRIADLAYVCDERERAILRLHLASNELSQTVNRLQSAAEERENALRATEARARDLAMQLRDAQRCLRAERWWSLKTPLRAAKRLLTAGSLRAAR
ncbi:MAG: hypothetical protein K2V38_18820, partial [Gemmataceae bacterium]|nr:hypothetical protein [Gemmataceae bacterium]